MTEISTTLTVEDGATTRSLNVDDFTDGVATEATLELVRAAVDGVEASLASLGIELAQKIEGADLSALATGAKQDLTKAVLDTISTTLATIDGHVDGLETALTTLNSKDFATQTTLAAVLAKISADPATQTTLAAAAATLTAIDGHVDGLEGKDFATQTTLAAVASTLTTIAGYIDGLEGFTDGLEGLIGTSNTTLSALAGYVDGLEGFTDNIESLLTTLGTYTDTLEALLTRGTFGYAAGTAAGNVNVPTGAKLTRVRVLAGSAVGATVTILGGDTITIPAGSAFNEEIDGDATGTSSTSEVVIGGTVQAYFIAWRV